MDFGRVKKEVSLGNRFVDWNDNILLDCSFADVETQYGAPYYFIHRADLIDLLVDTAKQHKNITLVMDCKVIDYDFETPAVKTATGDRYTADLIVGADGIKSAVRDTINGAPCEPIDTGDVAYRILVPAKPLLADPEMRHLVTNPWAVHWMGPEGHAVGYPLRGGELYNIIIDVTHATDLGEPIGLDEWRSQANNQELVARLRDWCPSVRKLCNLTGTYLKWKLADFPRLRRWVHPSSKVCLLGDACHPMMPYMAQGAAQATEDAATLAACLRRYPDDLRTALQIYQRRRLPRSAYVAKNTRIMQEWLHLYDGPARQVRDAAMKKNAWDNPIFWGHTARRDWLFGHDATVLPDDAHGEVDDEEGQIPPAPPFPPVEESVYHPDGCGVWKLKGMPPRQEMAENGEEEEPVAVAAATVVNGDT